MHLQMTDRKKEQERWLKKVVANGFKHLVVLNLRDQPAAETITITAAAWTQVLLKQNVDWEQSLDQKRLEEAFVTLMSTMERWPAPKNLLDVLPPREPLKALPPPPETPQRREHRRQSGLMGIRSVLEDMNILKKLKKEQ